MNKIEQCVSLLPYNTFGIDVSAAHFIVLDDVTDLAEITAAFPSDKYILGGGSNVLLTDDIGGLVIHNKLAGISEEREDDTKVWLRVQGGENWHDFVMHTVSRGLGGIENLALIPGSVGASPIQNIGAYGVEVRESIDSVTVWHWNERKFLILDNRDCNFGYRDSIFKRDLKDKAMVTSVLFRLDKLPKLRTSYGAITQELEIMKVPPSIGAIAEAVIRIRKSKLPDPKVTGNAGSFFKNPTLPREQYEKLHQQFPDMPSYKVGTEAVKIPAGWLIEQCGWKGKRVGHAGIHAKQALVLVNYGGATGEEIWGLSQTVLNDIEERFGILLEREVQVWQ